MTRSDVLSIGTSWEFDVYVIDVNFAVCIYGKSSKIALLRMRLPLSTLMKIGRSPGLVHRELNCWTAGITKKHRKIYERTYPTILVLPDGSSINVEYCEPRKIIALPLDLNTLSEAEKKARLERRKPKTKVTLVEDIEDDFDENRYLKFAKR